jgi:hypothetical protein
MFFDIGMDIKTWQCRKVCVRFDNIDKGEGAMGIVEAEHSLRMT